jgi:uncharacterized membrane protein (GlpM family)
LDLLLKGAVSGALITLVLLVARAERTQAAGLLVLFPAITLLSYYFVGQSEGEEQLRDVVRGSVVAFPVWLIFMGVVYFGLPVLGFRLALLAATGAWLLAGVLYLAFIRI